MNGPISISAISRKKGFGQERAGWLIIMVVFLCIPCSHPRRVCSPLLFSRYVKASHRLLEGTPWSVETLPLVLQFDVHDDMKQWEAWDCAGAAFFMLNKLCDYDKQVKKHAVIAVSSNKSAPHAELLIPFRLEDASEKRGVVFFSFALARAVVVLEGETQPFKSELAKMNHSLSLSDRIVTHKKVAVDEVCTGA